MTQVWMSNLTRKGAYHDVIDRRTPCGRFFGLWQGEPIRGHFVTIDAAVELGAVPCRRCSGEQRVVKPRVIASATGRKTAAVPAGAPLPSINKEGRQ